MVKFNIDGLVLNINIPKDQYDISITEDESLELVVAVTKKQTTKPIKQVNEVTKTLNKIESLRKNIKNETDKLLKLHENRPKLQPKPKQAQKPKPKITPKQVHPMTKKANVCFSSSESDSSSSDSDDSIESDVDVIASNQTEIEKAIQIAMK